MKQDIFEKVGKRTPYRTPDGYFEASEQLLKARSYRATTVVHRTSLHRALSWSFGIAAAIAFVIGIFGILRTTLPTSVPSDSPFYSQTVSADEPLYSQTDDASDDWSDFADADIFLDNMTW
jgi:hypothetical protein